MTRRKSLFITLVFILLLIIFAFILHFVGLPGTISNKSDKSSSQIPGEILEIINKPIYKDAIWGLRVADLETGEVIYDLKPDTLFLTGSVRKLFSVGLALNELGEDHRFITLVHRQGQVDDNGVLNGDLILVASGDLTMDGRRTPEDTMAIANLDHNEANSLGNAELTAPDPLAGYDKLAKQVVGSGITKINGDVIIDDRLFEPFNFRGEFDVRPIFVNDDVVDVIINPTLLGKLASVDWRPRSAAFGVKSGLLTVAEGKEKDIELNPEFPSCFGKDNCLGTVTGQLPIGFVPPLTNKFPLIQTFRIVEPSAYARTVFIEALKRAGVAVNTNLIGPNPSEKLPPENSYTPDTLVAKLVSLPYSEYTRLILKVSYNIGADVSLVLFGLTQGVNNIKDALEVERKTLVDNLGIPGDEFHFIDGSGGGESAATTKATVRLLKEMSERKVFIPFFDSLPVLGVDGSLSFVTDFEDDPSLAGAKGNVHAKTGTFAQGTAQGVLFRAETLAGYINAKSGRRLMFALYVNEVGIINSIDEILEVFQDQGTISAIIWREN
ncbi:MAG: D-alanyl-D-alanine carboxypeptidase [Candidatus Dadabacteria bacterium]|nr:D-alanyl-D-alanine carboxypeptidase [Candidatus Dadabacteria bacterium]